MKTLNLMLMPLMLGSSCDRRPPRKESALQTPVSWPDKATFENFSGGLVPFIRDGAQDYLDEHRHYKDWVYKTNTLHLNQTYALSFDVVFLKAVHGPIIDLGGDLPCEVTVTPFQKADYQKGERERIYCTVKPLKTGKDVLLLMPMETDAEGYRSGLDQFRGFPVLVEE